MIAEFITIKSILDKHIFDEYDVIYLSDNGKSQGFQEYPFLLLRDGKEKNGNDNTIDDNLLMYDLVELKKLLTPQKSNKNFFEKLINGNESYANIKEVASDVRTQFLVAWKALYDEVGTIVKPILINGGLIAIPNPGYFFNKFNGHNPNYPEIREEFHNTLNQCIINNTKEAFRINQNIEIEDKKITCTKEFKAFSEKLARKEILNLKQ